MKQQFVRTAMLLGEDGVESLRTKRVAVFGIGGVGGHAAEVLVRSGVGALDLIDSDVVSQSNLNRQIIATWDTVGRQKTEVMRERILSINPDCAVTCHNMFYLPEKREDLPFAEYDYLVDAIDTVTAKIDLAVAAQEYGIAIVSSMGTGNKLDPARLEIADIYDTSVCPLAKVMRRELKKRGVRKLTVVYSKEEARKPYWIQDGTDAENDRRAVPGSTAFVPAAAGLMLGGYVVRQLADVVGSKDSGYSGVADSEDSGHPSVADSKDSERSGVADSKDSGHSGRAESGGGRSGGDRKQEGEAVR